MERAEVKGRFVAVVGPTAVGKTALAVRLAVECHGEIVSADSRQIYRHMDIGTAKATPEEQRAACHHLIDIREPNETLTLAQYQQLAFQAIDAILARGRLPLLVGGTGLYIRAVTEGLVIPQVAPNEALRRELSALAEREGAEAVHRQLAAVDPRAAAGIDARNVRRVIRALEVYLQTGSPISSQQEAQAPPYEILQIGLTMPRADLYRRIDERIERMVTAGLVDEVRSLLARGFDADLPAMSGVGYRQIAGYLRGDTDEAGAVDRIKHDTRRFVRQQANWFRDDGRIDWFDVGSQSEDPYPAILNRVLGFQNGQFSQPKKTETRWR